MSEYEWEAVTSTRRSYRDASQLRTTLAPPPGDGWALERVDMKTDTLYVVPKEGWGSPECQTYVTVLALWKRLLPAETPQVQSER
jgi:hypothetical protein